MIPATLIDSFNKQRTSVKASTLLLNSMEKKVADNAQKGVKYMYSLQGEVEFSENAQEEQQITLLVPMAHGVYIDRIAVYPSSRFVTTDEVANGPNELTYRPCVLTSGEHVFNSRIDIDKAALDLRISISETFSGVNGPISRDLQNGPVSSKLFYTDSKNYRQNRLLTGTGRAFSSFDHGKGLFMVEPWYLPSGSSVTFKITPSFAGLREDPAVAGADETQKTQYKVDVILSGYKRDN